MYARKLCVSLKTRVRPWCQWDSLPKYFYSPCIYSIYIYCIYVKRSPTSHLVVLKTNQPGLSSVFRLFCCWIHLLIATASEAHCSIPTPLNLSGTTEPIAAAYRPVNNTASNAIITNLFNTSITLLYYGCNKHNSSHTETNNDADECSKLL